LFYLFFLPLGKIIVAYYTENDEETQAQG